MKKFKIILNSQKGITLIALTITIIVLLILAGVSLKLLLDNGLLEKAKLANEKTKQAQLEENSRLEQYENLIKNHNGNNSNVPDQPEILTADLFAIEPNNSSWKVENVKEALDYLYNN